jgi:osmotically-inducible protein OsmY
VDSTPANDAQLIQLVRGALGRRSPRINVSSCSFIVTLHGITNSGEERDEIEAAVRAVPGVRDVSSKLRVAQDSDRGDSVSDGTLRGI